MKCKNCGHANQPNALKCTSCNAPFNGSMILEQAGSPSLKADITCKNCGTSNASNHVKCTSCNAPLAGTNIFAQVEASIPTSIISEGSDSCKDCGYPNVNGSTQCAACKKPLNQGASTKRGNVTPKRKDQATNVQVVKQAKPLKKKVVDRVIDPSMTVNPWVLDQVEEGGFSLTPFVKGELLEEQMKDFTEDQVVLNRANLDPKNTTITNKKQATIKYTDGAWAIENNSDLGTTFILVSSQKTLEDGDVILLGNAMYKFTTKS